MTNKNPTLTICERQLELLGELAEMTIVVARSYAHAAVAAAAAVEAVVADEYYQSETERARALAGAKDAADGFQKVSRSLRLTLVLQMSVAEAVRDMRLGIVPNRATPPVARKHFESVLDATAPAPDRDKRDREHGFTNPDRLGSEHDGAEYDRRDRPYTEGFEATVNGVGVDIGAKVDWCAMTIRKDDIRYKPFVKKPIGAETGVPSPEYQARKAKRLLMRPGRPPPKQR